MKTLTLVNLTYPGEFKIGIKTRTDLSDLDICACIFDEWNAGSGKESASFAESGKRSMCVGDFVTIRQLGRHKIYQCAGSGWTERTVEFKELFERRVKNHSRFSEGAWFALQDVLWEDRINLDKQS